MTTSDREREGAGAEPIVYFGTPDFAVPPLEALVEAGLAPALVVSQPSRPVGRAQRVQPPPVARWAVEHGVPLVQPERLDDRELAERLRALEPGVAVVVAFGQIFPSELLTLPRFGCVNLHASLLPRHRGAAPIQAAIAAGDEVTGVTTMLMDEGLDTGPVLLTREIPIGPGERAGELAERLAAVGGSLLVETLERLAAGTLEPTPQDDARATYARRLKKADGRIDWSLPADAIARRLCAYDPWPGCFAVSGEERIKVLSAAVRHGAIASQATPGTIVALDGDEMVVACGQGTALAIGRAQRPGRSRVSGRDLANGLRLAVGDRLD